MLREQHGKWWKTTRTDRSDDQCGRGPSRCQTRGVEVKAGSNDSETLEPQVAGPALSNQEHRESYKAFVDRARCFGCAACATACRFGAITVDMRKATIDPAKCTGCGLCLAKCAVGVISMRN